MRCNVWEKIHVLTSDLNIVIKMISLLRHTSKNISLTLYGGQHYSEQKR